MIARIDGVPSTFRPTSDAASSRPRRRPRVTILWQWMPHYRKPFFEHLHTRLDDEGIELTVIYGQPDSDIAQRNDTVTLEWGAAIRNRWIRVGSKEACWQPCLGALLDSDLTVVEQASRMLVNYPLFAIAKARRRPLVAFWGHGANLKAHLANPAAEGVKRVLSRRADWWFAYTEGTSRIVRDIGYPAERITVVQNSIDTLGLLEARKSIAPDRLAALREELGLRGQHVGLYVGGMSPNKRLGFLLDACRLIHQRIPDFEMVFVGSGTDRRLVDEAARVEPWIVSAGPRFGDERIPFFMLSKVLLMPGLVGLGVVDAITLEVPMVTTAISFHSPEVEYLVDGLNGRIVADAESRESYAAAVAGLLADDQQLELLREGCRQTRGRYSVEDMAERFAGGIERALGLARLS